MNDNADGEGQQQPDGQRNAAYKPHWTEGPSQPRHPQASVPPPPQQQWGGPQWVPAPQAPRPGTLWLRPQEFADAFTAGWATMRANLRTFLSINVVPLVLMFVSAGVVGGVTAASGVLDTLNESSEPPVGTIVSLLAAATVGLVLLWIVSLLIQAANVHVFGQSALGRKTTARRALATGLRRVPALFGVWLILFLVIGVPALLLIGGMIALIAASDEAAIGLIAFFAAMPLVVLAWLALMPRLAFTPYAVVLERLGPVAALKRSWALTRGRFWRTLGTVLVITIVASTASSIVTMPMQFGMPAITSSLEDRSEPSAGFVIAFIVFLLIFLAASVIFQALSQAFTTAGIGAMYADARIRDENLAQQIAHLTATMHPTPADAPVKLEPGELEFPLPH